MMEMDVARRVAVAMLGITAVACSSAGDAGAKDSARRPAPAVVMTTLQPRPELDEEIDPRDTMFAPGSGRPYPGSWTPTTTYVDTLFTIEPPASANVRSRAAQPQYGRPNRDVIINQLPECKWYCSVSIEVWRDSTGGGFTRPVRTIKAEDSSQSMGYPDEPTFLDSLPLGRAPAIHLETYCGDCTSGVIRTASGGWIAEIEYSSDDRNPFDPALLERLRAVARSFRWRR
jgi:hypothetical protein